MDFGPASTPVRGLRQASLGLWTAFAFRIPRSALRIGRVPRSGLATATCHGVVPARWNEAGSPGAPGRSRVPRWRSQVPTGAFAKSPPAPQRKEHPRGQERQRARLRNHVLRKEDIHAARVRSGGPAGVAHGQGRGRKRPRGGADGCWNSSRPSGSFRSSNRLTARLS